MPIASDHRSSYLASWIVMLPEALEDMNFEKVIGTRGVTGVLPWW